MADHIRSTAAEIGIIVRDCDRLVLRLPLNIKVPEGEASVGREGSRLIVEWQGAGLLDLLAGIESLASEDELPDVD